MFKTGTLKTSLPEKELASLKASGYGLTLTGSAVTLGCSPRVRPGEGQLLPTPAINTDLTGEGWDQVSAKFYFCRVGASDLLRGETCASSVVILKNSQTKMWEFLFQDLTSGHVSLLCASAESDVDKRRPTHLY